MNKLSLAGFASALLILTSNIRAIPVAYGDLILGFRANGGEGAAVNLEVNLGPASQFYGAAAGTTSILTGLSVEDLKATYGEDWNTRTDLNWGIIGTTGPAAVNGVPARTIWASRSEATPGTASTPWQRSGTFTLQVSSTAIATMYTGAIGSMDRYNPTPNSATAIKVLTSDPGSWTAQDDFDLAVSFRYFNPTVVQPMGSFPTEGSAYDGTGYSVLDLWEVRPGAVGAPATLVGGFGINNTGKLVFSTDITKFAPGTTPPTSLGSPTIVRNGGTVTISLSQLAAGSYILERSTSMADGTWETLQTKSPTSGTVSYDDAAPPSPRAFYRIRKGS
jgi:hypothetical protein